MMKSLAAVKVSPAPESGGGEREGGGSAVGTTQICVLPPPRLLDIFFPHAHKESIKSLFLSSSRPKYTSKGQVGGACQNTTVFSSTGLVKELIQNHV